MFELDEYVKANSIDEVISIMKENKGAAKIVSGGTLIHELAGRGMLDNVKVLIDLQRLGLNYVKEEDDLIRIGAMTTHSKIHEHYKDEPRYGALAEAANLIPQIRNAATIGGCVCPGIPWLELPVALLSYDSKLVVQGTEGERLINLNEFYLDYLYTTLQPMEFLTEIRIPKPVDGTISKHISHRITTVGVPIVSVAVTVVKDAKNMCTDARIAIGSAGRVVMRAEKAEERLKGKVLEPKQLFDDVVEAVLSKIKPINDMLATETYRKHICKILVQKVLEELE